MPVLREGEKMQRCQSSFHSFIRRQKYYIKRTYYNKLEQKFCAGCCGHLARTYGLLKYTIGEGYVPASSMSIEEMLERYTAEEFQHGR